MALVHDLELDINELSAGEKRVKRMLELYRSGKWTKVEIQYHYNEWLKIAERVKNGATMLDGLKPVRPESIAYEKRVSDLYTFLMKLLGMYDMFFKHMYRERPDLYERALENILAKAQ